MYSIIILSLALLSHLVNATHLSGQVVWNSLCSSLDDLHPQTIVVLDGGRWKSRVRKDGKFAFHNVESGTYTLEILARDHVFDQLRIDVLDHKDDLAASEAFSPVQVRPLIPGTPHFPNPPLPLLSYPISIHAQRTKVYFVPRETFDIISMFKNPMMLMMLFTGVMVFLMPKLMENMDPELVKEMKERQDKMFNVQSKLQSGDIGGGLAGLLGGDETPAAEESKKVPIGQPATQNRKGGNKKKR